MFKVVILLVFTVATCYGETTAKPVYCGNIPNYVLNCMKAPIILPIQSLSKCPKPNQDPANQCDLMTCVFRENNWFLSDGQVDKSKVAAHFNQVGKDKPEWQSVINNVITGCVEHQLPAQGVYLRCPAYDIMHCALMYFIKKAPESQWMQGSSCEYSRQYAASCPVCPNDCFAPQVPYGSCNACYLVKPQ